jgi:hypothetical protein
METNIINSIFFILICFNIAMIGKNDNKDETIKWTLRSSNMLKLYGTIILMSMIFFIVFVGTLEKAD